MVALALLLASGGCQSPPAPAREFVVQADQLHDAALASAVVPDAELKEYLDEIGRRIVEGATAANPNNTRDQTLRNMKFHLVSSPEVVNVFGTGGRHIYVFSGLLRYCETEEELAALLAHAYAHALDLDLQQTGMRPDPQRTLDNLERVVYAFATNRTTAVHERRADERAFEFYARGGWAPNRFANIFEALPDRGIEGATDTPAPGRLPFDQRAALAREQLAKLPRAARDWRKPNVADPQNFARLRRAAAALEEGPAPTLARPWLYLRAFPNCVLPTDQPLQREAQEWLRRKLLPPPPEQGIEPS
jgi:predicted Zn-dependent protease